MSEKSSDPSNAYYIGYLGHPFKYGHVKREKDLLTFVAYTGGSV